MLLFWGKIGISAHLQMHVYFFSTTKTMNEIGAMRHDMGQFSFILQYVTYSHVIQYMPFLLKSENTHHRAVRS